MPKYASFDHTQPAPQMVNGWYDTDLLTYPNLPSMINLLLLNDSQWTGRLVNPSAWMVSGGALLAYVPPTPPPPTLAQQAQSQLASGMPLISTGTSSLDGTYPCTPAAQANETGLLTALNAGLTLPGGVAVILDVSGNPHAFSPSNFLNYCQAKLIFTQELNTIIGTDSGSLPSLPVTIA